MVPNPSPKQRLRARLRSTRAALSNRPELQARIDAHLVGLPHLRSSPPPRTVAVFSARPDEASPAALFEPLRDRRLAFPRVEGRDLVFHLARASELRPGCCGILEPPASTPTVEAAEIDLFIVPGLGFTRAGARIGYGRGFYDRVLTRARETRNAHAAPAIGLGFEIQVVGELPMEPHDVLLDGLVTEIGFLACSMQSPPALR